MKIYLLWLIAFFSTVTYSQGNSILLTNKNTERVKVIAEHKRIKIVTVEGESYVGRFTIVDSTSIQIHGEIIPLNSIVKLQKRSVFGAITGLVSITIGYAISCVAIGASPFTGGVSFILLPIAIPFLTIPEISHHHKSKDWQYSIR